jgi:hypothetical protein
MAVVADGGGLQLEGGGHLIDGQIDLDYRRRESGPWRAQELQ